MDEKTRSNSLRVFMYSHPRTRSNLLIRLLESHPKIVQMQYPFMDAFSFGPDNQDSRSTKKRWKLETTGMTEEQFAKEYAGVTFQAGVDKIEELIAKAESEGRIPVIKEHVYLAMASSTLNSYLKTSREIRPKPVVNDRMLDVAGGTGAESLTPSLPVPNPTLIPDRLFVTLSPLIIIRHPAHTLPSFMRASSSFGGSIFEDDFQLMASYRWQRLIYDCYAAYYDTAPGQAKKGIWPIVVDGDKLVSDTKGQMMKLCSAMGLDEASIQYTWESGEPVKDKVVDAFLGDLQRSTGVVNVPEKTDPPVISELAKKWAVEWNEDVAAKLRDCVEAAMEDYEYLLQFSL